MRTCCVACSADKANLIPGLDVIADLDVGSTQVCVHRSDAAMVGDDDQLPPAACHDAGPDDPTWRGCRDRRAQRGGEVDPAVKAEAAWPERRANGRMERPCEPDRAVWQRVRFERNYGPPSSNAVGFSTGPALVADEGSLDV
jgi:hypothetical protein